jgi:glyoxylase-like metal-dependent hydrolase (beta-lactamase superfamily II)
LSAAAEIAPGIVQLDTMLGGMDQLTAGFLVRGSSPALVETGSQTSIKAVREALSQQGVDSHDLRWIIVTHIHLDHAGGVGDLAAAYPDATVVVHERGARHLVDPSRLVDSAARVYGPLLDSLYGRMTPVLPDRVLPAADGMRIEVGPGRNLVMVDSPGHAKHHHAVLDEQTGALLVGDAVGVRLPDVGVLRPATPPPDFDLEQAVASLRRFASLQPQRVVLTHYGPVDDGPATLAAAEDLLHQWVAVAQQTLAAAEEAGVDDVAAALADAFAGTPDGLTGRSQERLEVLNGIHSNAAGIVRYLRSRQPPAEA